MFLSAQQICPEAHASFMYTAEIPEGAETERERAERERAESEQPPQAESGLSPQQVIMPAQHLDRVLIVTAQRGSRCRCSRSTVSG